MSYNNVRRRGRERQLVPIKIICSGMDAAVQLCGLEFFSVSAVAPASAFRRKVKHHAM